MCLVLGIDDDSGVCGNQQMRQVTKKFSLGSDVVSPLIVTVTVCVFLTFDEIQRPVAALRSNRCLDRASRPQSGSRH